MPQKQMAARQVPGMVAAVGIHIALYPPFDINPAYYIQNYPPCQVRPFPQSAGLVGQQKGFPVGSPFECARALQRPQKLRLQVPPAVQRRGDLRQQRLPVAVQCALQRQIVAGMVGAEHGSFAVHVL